MIRPNAQELDELHRVNGMHPAFVAWLQNRRVAYMETLAKQRDDVEFRITQGKAQELGEILDLLQQSAELATKRRAL